MAQISVYTAVGYDQTLQGYGCQIAKAICKFYVKVIIEMVTREENTDHYTSPPECDTIHIISIVFFY